MGRRHGVNDPGGTAPPGGNEIIRILVEGKGFIPLAPCDATASFSALEEWTEVKVKRYSSTEIAFYSGRGGDRHRANSRDKPVQDGGNIVVVAGS